MLYNMWFITLYSLNNSGHMINTFIKKSFNMIKYKGRQIHHLCTLCGFKLRWVHVFGDISMLFLSVLHKTLGVTSLKAPL